LWAPLVGVKRAKELAFVPGNWIDGPTAVQWGWANHCVEEDELVGAVEDLAARISLTPSDVLRIKKLSINRAMEAMGVRSSWSAVAEMDSLLHLSPEVLELRRAMHDNGLKATMASFRVPPTTPLVKHDASEDTRDG
jgi:enoyl-CoA hydratase